MDITSLHVHSMCVLSVCLKYLIQFLYSTVTLFLLYSDADVHDLMECARDALEQQNSGTAVNDRYVKLTLIILLVPHFKVVLTCTVHICYLPGRKSIWEKTLPEVLSTEGLGPYTRPRAQFFHTDQPCPVNNMFIFFLQ